MINLKLIENTSFVKNKEMITYINCKVTLNPLTPNRSNYAQRIGPYLIRIFFSLSYNPPGILQLRILQPLVHLKNFGYNKDIDIGFIAEDKIGHFVIVKLDADLTLKPGEWKQFVGKCVDICFQNH